MLGHGRFTFETPNVIDPGDMPPSRPSRLQKDLTKSDEISVGSNSNSNRTRRTNNTNNTDDENDPRTRVYKPPLSRAIKIDYRLDADDEPEIVTPIHDDDEDDPEYGMSNSRKQGARASPPLSPSHEQARLFAATILSESERRASSKRNLMGGDPSSPSESPVRKMMQGLRRSSANNTDSMAPLRWASGLEQEDRSMTKSQREQHRRRACRKVFCMLAIIGLVFAFGYAAWIGLRSRSAYNSSGSSSRLQDTIDVLASTGISELNDLTKVSSPQYQAARWISMEDSDSLDIPTSLKDNPFRFVQRYVLAVLYFAWQGDDWINAYNFKSDMHECSWFDTEPDSTGDTFAVGVTCDERLQVRNLLLPSNNLKGTIPPEIQHLTKLDFLDLKDNDLSGSIPSALKELPLLYYLDLKFNQLTGSIPHFLGDLQRLKVLGLSKNQLEGSLPGSLGTLSGLQTLAIDGNHLTGDLAPVAMMTNLEYLYAEENDLHGNLDHGLLADLKSLIEADLSGNRLESAMIPTHMFSLPQLRVLDLSSNSISGSLPTSLPDNSVLEYLNLRMNSISSSIPGSISNLGALTHLDLEANAFTGDLPAESLASLKDLSYLFLGKNPSLNNATMPDSFQSLTGLRELSMDYVGLQGGIPTWMGNLSNLKLLDLRNNQLTGSLEAVGFSNMNELTYLLLSDNQLIGSIPKELGSLEDLAVVSLHHNGLIGEAGDLCKAESEVRMLTTDCGDITCDCCDECCDSDNCYEGYVWDVLENSNGTWEEHFRRADYAFNPHLLKTGDDDKSNQDN